MSFIACQDDTQRDTELMVYAGDVILIIIDQLQHMKFFEALMEKPYLCELRNTVQRVDKCVVRSVHKMWQ